MPKKFYFSENLNPVTCLPFSRGEEHPYYGETFYTSFDKRRCRCTFIRASALVKQRASISSDRKLRRACMSDNDARIISKHRSAKARAKRARVDFAITHDDIRAEIAATGGICPLLDLPFDTCPGMRASIDRIIPSLGYIPGNFWIISSRCNASKFNRHGGDRTRESKHPRFTPEQRKQIADRIDSKLCEAAAIFAADIRAFFSAGTLAAD